jgi:hypothetical protein
MKTERQLGTFGIIGLSKKHSGQPYFPILLGLNKGLGGRQFEVSRRQRADSA